MNFKKKWEEYLRSDRSDEWAYSNFIDSISESLDAEGCFNIIPEVIDSFFEEEDDYNQGELLQLIYFLAVDSDTTEIPKKLLENLNRIEQAVSNLSEYDKNKFKELKKWYRI